MNNITQNTVNFITNLVLKVLLAVVAVALLLYAAGGGIFTGSLFSFKRAKPTLTVAKTPMTIQDVRAVGKLVTATFYDEMIVKGSKQQLVKTNDGHSGEIVIIQKARVRLGVDLAKLRDKDIIVEKDTTIRIVLPPVECLHVVMNPTDTDIYSETTSRNKQWTFEQFKEVQEPVKETLLKRVYASKAMEKALQGAKEIVTEFLTACGYKHVIVTPTPTKALTLPATEPGKVTPGA